MHEYYPLAINISEGMRQMSNASFIFTTHPWIVHRYLHCPCPELQGACPARTLSNSRAPHLECPTQRDVEAFAAAVRRGDVAWSAAPLNLQAEGMSPDLSE